jgi:hypothetical protein
MISHGASNDRDVLPMAKFASFTASRSISSSCRVHGPVLQSSTSTHTISLTSVSFLTVENFLVISIPAILFRSINNSGDLGPHARMYLVCPVQSVSIDEKIRYDSPLEIGVLLCCPEPFPCSWIVHSLNLLDYIT